MKLFENGSVNQLLLPPILWSVIQSEVFWSMKMKKWKRFWES